MITRACASRIIATLTVVLSGCGEPTTSAALEPCSGDVTVTVTSGTTPRFSWSPACTMIALLVEEEADDRWFILGDTEEGFRPGVRYGTEPVGATQGMVALPLTVGVQYDVILYRGTVVAPTISGIREFTP